jgi:hypothetical protein
MDLDITTLDKPLLSDATPYDKKIKQIYETYNLYCDYRITQEELEYNWTDNFNWSGKVWLLEPIKTDYIEEVLDFYENKVLNVIPKELITKFAKHRVGLVGRFHWPIKEDAEDPNSALIKDVEINGWLGHGYLALGMFNEAFKTCDKKELQRSWVSLTIEGMLENMPNPNEFYQVSTETYDAWFPSIESISEYNEDGVLYMHRKGPKESSWGSFYYESFSPAQDFADYVAYILLNNNSEKEEIRAKSKAGLILKKEQMVKDFFLNNFNIQLPEPK